MNYKVFYKKKKKKKKKSLHFRDLSVHFHLHFLSHVQVHVLTRCVLILSNAQVGVTYEPSQAYFGFTWISGNCIWSLKRGKMNS
jgi:hypothetical protein